MGRLMSLLRVPRWHLCLLLTLLHQASCKSYQYGFRVSLEGTQRLFPQALLVHLHVCLCFILVVNPELYTPTCNMPAPDWLPLNTDLINTVQAVHSADCSYIQLPVLSKTVLLKLHHKPCATAVCITASKHPK